MKKNYFESKVEGLGPWLVSSSKTDNSMPPHLFFLTQRLPPTRSNTEEEDALLYFIKMIEKFREISTPVDSNTVEKSTSHSGKIPSTPPVTHTYFFYCHSSGPYLPGSRAFFSEIVKSVECLFPLMRFVVVHPTVAIKALFAFWFATGAISSHFWQHRVIYCENVKAVEKILSNDGLTGGHLDIDQSINYGKEVSGLRETDNLIPPSLREFEKSVGIGENSSTIGNLQYFWGL